MARKSSRGANGSGCIRQRTVMRDGKKYSWWEAQFCAGVDKGTGRTIRKTITGKTQKEVAEKLRAVTVTIDKDEYFEPSKIPLGVWCNSWLEEYTGDLKYLTRKTYAAQITNHIVPGLGAMELGNLARPDERTGINPIQKFINDLTRKKNLSPKSVKNIHGVLSAILDTAVTVGHIQARACFENKYCTAV